MQEEFSLQNVGRPSNKDEEDLVTLKKTMESAKELEKVKDLEVEILDLAKKQVQKRQHDDTAEAPKLSRRTKAHIAAKTHIRPDKAEKSIIARMEDESCLANAVTFAAAS